MPTLRFVKNRKPISVKANEDLMEALRSHNVPVASSCGGDGVCTKCLIEVYDGNENLTAPNERELNLRKQHDIPENFRVSCQVQVLGDLLIDTPYW